MKKILLIVMLLVTMAGCSAVPTFETLGNIPHGPSGAQTPAQVLLELPEEAVEDVFAGEEETLYTCRDYAIAMKTLSAGDLSGTIKSLSGYDKTQLTVMETSSDQASRYDWVWTSTGEEGDLLGRAAVLDDGRYHYCLWVMAPAGKAGELAQEWNALFSSFRLEQ